MMKRTDNKSYRSKLQNSLFGALGGMFGGLLLNLTIPGASLPSLLSIYVLPGSILGACLGYFTGPWFGRTGAAILSAFVSYILILVGILIWLK